MFLWRSIAVFICIQEKVIPENEKLKQDVKGLQVVIEEYKKRER